jgi:hypothetical protein
VGVGQAPSSQSLTCVKDQMGQAAVLPQRRPLDVLRGQRATSAPLGHANYPLHEGGRESITPKPDVEELLADPTETEHDATDSPEGQARTSAPTGRQVWPVQSSACSGRHGRPPRYTQTRRGTEHVGQPDVGAPLVPSRAPSASWVQGQEGLSRMRGNSHVRF